MRQINPSFTEHAKWTVDSINSILPPHLCEPLSSYFITKTIDTHRYHITDRNIPVNSFTAAIRVCRLTSVTVVNISLLIHLTYDNRSFFLLLMNMLPLPLFLSLTCCSPESQQLRHHQQALYQVMGTSRGLGTWNKNRTYTWWRASSQVTLVWHTLTISPPPLLLAFQSPFLVSVL